MSQRESQFHQHHLVSYIHLCYIPILRSSHETRNSRETKLNYDIKLRKIMSYFQLITPKFL